MAVEISDTSDNTELGTFVARNLVGHVIGPRIDTTQRLQLRGYADGEIRNDLLYSGISLEHDGNDPIISLSGGSTVGPAFRMRYEGYNTTDNSERYLYIEKNKNGTWSPLMILTE